MSRSRLLAEIALAEGFDVVGFGPATPDPRTAGQFDAWLAAGRHGEMGWLERNRDRILDAEAYVPGARGSISLGLEYPAEPCVVPDDGAAAQHGKVARYAAGRDYHRSIGKRLERLHRKLEQEGLAPDTLRHGVDAVPILERSLAAQAGIGFVAKSAGIIDPDRGPWLMLAEVLHGEELELSAPARGSCGTCTACLDACPTDALVAPFELDARRCLSYTTIEKRGVIPWEMREPQGDWLFGCDICIEVCPFTSKARKKRSDDTDLALHPALETYTLVGILELDLEAWNRDWTGTAIRRARIEGLRRNAAIVLGNLGATHARDALEAGLGDEDRGVRTAAAWALGSMGIGREALSRAVDAESDPEIRSDLARSLELARVR